MRSNAILFLLTFLCFAEPAFTQTATDTRSDKVSHAEPLYYDLVRDLGARKGEKELNVGVSMEDNRRFHTLGGLVEYEFAPANRLGVEVEVPFSVHFKSLREQQVDLPLGGINGIKLATQYTFFVSKKHGLSLAAGYANDFELGAERINGKIRLSPENISQPFFVAAKSWKGRFHTLLHTGPVLGVHLRNGMLDPQWMVNTSFHYMFPGGKNFVGMEVNQMWGPKTGSLVLRPQFRVAVSKRTMLGFVTGIPMVGDEGMSFFCRLIYEPGKR